MESTSVGIVRISPYDAIGRKKNGRGYKGAEAALGAAKYLHDPYKTLLVLCPYMFTGTEGTR
ncbi:hypothetical protein DSL72_008822 [Monilinia vaccinii-corymbosi]|uniref:Uncharacterized protein n=1 Tax=Monilinia vaccinii-corymbosi TaxID=61207 RepID=A0A8A3PRS2_9HELO|nr:hypothetical protein DSL72_008822 [Monilinia vaccinii-corymbosi]